MYLGSDDNDRVARAAAQDAMGSVSTNVGKIRAPVWPHSADAGFCRWLVDFCSAILGSPDVAVLNRWEQQL